MNNRPKALLHAALNNPTYTQSWDSAGLGEETLFAGIINHPPGTDLKRRTYLTVSGLACEVFRADTGRGEWDFAGEVDYTRLIFTVDGQSSNHLLPQTVAKWYGVTPEMLFRRPTPNHLGTEPSVLTSLLDLHDAGIPFTEIAKYLLTDAFAPHQP